jgi:hypothetical protein
MTSLLEIAVLKQGWRNRVIWIGLSATHQGNCQNEGKKQNK